ncbi:hypothetical protein ERJ75_001461500 [Trypanosoma vivax]|nr:hypothetical protein ERJ75_001461500 [Trypanosoma vivax]
MPSRLGSALLSYFSRHIERGDWHACLKSLRGCMEAGTLNHHLPCVSLFPFLLAHGQWESALRVAGDVVASLQGLARKADKNECGDEKEFYNSILRSLSVPDVARSKGCWRMAMAIVQYAAERRVQLEEEVVRNALSRVILWEEAGDISSGNGRSSSSKGTAAAAVSSEIQTAPHAREIERREALQRMHETLLQQGHFGESQYLSTRIGSDVTSGGATVLQLDLIRALSAVLEESLKTEASAAASHWLRFREQMMTSFGSSWEGTVHTLLRVCAPSHLLPMTVDVDAEKTAPWGGGVIDNMVLQPDVADRVLGVALDCMFDSSVIPPPTSGAGAAVACCECTLGSLEWWRSHLASEVAHSRERELQKWKAVVLLAMCKLEKREQWWETLSDFSALNDKEQHAITNRPGSEVAMDIKLLKRLCVSSQLVLLHGKLNDEEIKNVLRKLLFHGSSALSVHGKVGELVETIQLLVSTIQVLMAAGSRSSRMPHPESATMLNSALDTPAPVEFPCEMSGQHISSCRGAGSHLVKKQCLSSSRAVYWDSVLFPTSWEISCSTLQGSVNTTGTPGRLSWEGAWQLLLQRVFEDNSMISMWFSDEDYGVFSAEGDNGSPECVESLPLRAQQSASPTTDIHSVKSSGHQRSASYSSRGHRVILHGDAFRHLVKLLHFLGRRHDTEERKFPLDFNGCGNPHFSSLCSPNRGPDRFNHEQIKHAEVWTPNSGTGVSTPLLSQVVRHQQDANRLGEALLSLHINSVEGNVVNSVSDVGRMLRTLAASVPRKFIKPLLGHMINFVSRPLSKVRADTATASPWWTCYVALVAFMHKSRTCTSSQKSGHSAALLNLMEPRTFAWWPALVLFSEATVPICQQQWEKEGLKWSTRTQGKGNGSSTTISHIMDAMLVKASTPRWREALQVEAMFRALQPFDHNHHLRAQQNTKRIPLDESERIDLYEAAIQLRRRNQWAVAAALLTAHASRRLSGQDVAPFSFVLAHVPLCFIQSVLLILVRERERNCDVAKAALAACVRSARQSHREMFVSVESRQLTMNNCPTVDAVDREIANCAVTAQDLREQERVFFQHEVLDAMSLALQVWPTPITRDEDYVLIWRYLRYGCGGDARMARLLLRRSSLLDSPYAKAEVESLAHTVSLCHSAQDGSSAAAAYAAFLMKRRGLQLPTKTLLMLLDLCTLAVDDSVGQDEGSKTELHGHRDASLLHALLEEALMASHLTGDSETVSFNSKNESIFVHVCRIIFRLRGSTYSCKGVPWLHSDVGPGVKRHILRFLHLVVRHLEDSDAVFLANLPFFVGVLRSLPLTVMKAAETEMGRGGVGSKSNEDQSFTQLSVLTARMLLRAERMERQLNTIVIFDCIFWLYVMKYTALTEYVFPCRDGNVWNGQRVGSPCLDALHAQVSSGLNERTNAEALLHATVLKASNHVRDRMVERTHQEAEAMGRVIHSCFVEAVLYVFEQCRIVPLPSSLLLTGVALALGGKSEVHTLWPICGSDVCFYPIPLHTLALIQMLIASLNTRWVLEELAVTTCSNDTLMITTNETATFTARVTVSYVKDLVGLLSSLTASCLRSMNEADEERDVLKEVAGNCDVKCELSCISRLIASVAGMCMAVQKTLPLGACMDELQRLCESLRRALHRNEGKTCGIAMLPNHTSFLLRVVSTVLSGTEDQSSDNLVERLLANFSSGASASDTGLFADNHTDLALAMALLQVSLCGAPLVDSFLCTFIPTLLSDVASNAPLKEKTARIIALALCYLASFGSTSAVRCFLAVIPLSAATQLLTSVGEGLPLVGLLAFHGDLGHESRPPPRFLLPDNTLVSLIVFGELAAVRHARWGAAVHTEADVTAMMDVISNIVPHRWDMAVAIALGFPLLSSAGSEYEVSAAGTVLGNRLAHALQSFGSWPPGRMLEAVVGTCFISVSQQIHPTAVRLVAEFYLTATNC